MFQNIFGLIRSAAGPNKACEGTQNSCKYTPVNQAQNEIGARVDHILCNPEGFQQTLISLQDLMKSSTFTQPFSAFHPPSGSGNVPSEGKRSAMPAAEPEPKRIKSDRNLQYGDQGSTSGDAVESGEARIENDQSERPIFAHPQILKMHKAVRLDYSDIYSHAETIRTWLQLFMLNYDDIDPRRQRKLEWAEDLCKDLMTVMTGERRHQIEYSFERRRLLREAREALSEEVDEETGDVWAEVDRIDELEYERMKMKIRDIVNRYIVYTATICENLPLMGLPDFIAP